MSDYLGSTRCSTVSKTGRYSKEPERTRRMGIHRKLLKGWKRHLRGHGRCNGRLSPSSPREAARPSLHFKSIIHKTNDGQCAMIRVPGKGHEGTKEGVQSFCYLEQRLTLPDLPEDLVHMIMSSLASRDLKSARATCSTLNTILEPVVFRTLVLDVSLGSFLSLLFGLSGHQSGPTPQRRSRIVRHVRILSVRSLSVRPTSQTSNIGDSDESEGETGNHLLVLGEREREAIAMTARQLVNLKIVEWNVQEHDPPWSFPTIIDSLSTIPGNPLSEMNITLLGNFDRVVPLSRLPSTLRSLRIGGPGYIESEEMLREIGNAIRGNEVVLERLSVGPSRLDTGFRLEKIGRQREQDSLDILFKDRKKGPSRLLPPSTVLLSDLALDGWDLTSLNSHAIMTQALKSLVLTDCTVPADFWARLHASHVQLHTLRLKHVVLNDGFLRYLQGYGDGLQGLTHLELRLNGEEYTGFLASRFFGEVLPQHSDSLEELVIFSEGNDNGLDVKSQVGEWCFQPKNANAFAACHALRFLTVMMDPDSDSPTEDNVALLFTTIDQNLFKLQTLTLLSGPREAAPRRTRQRRQGSGWYRRVQATIIELRSSLPADMKGLKVYVGNIYQLTL
ncbi:hypothetical protein PM082_014316 [Marasmius tenuissimus]|nr:hypothetical protein PM082_014316 [Marasmius tenuissimus]